MFSEQVVCLFVFYLLPSGGSTFNFLKISKKEGSKESSSISKTHRVLES